jgi:hypothetical protein
VCCLESRPSAPRRRLSRHLVALSEFELLAILKVGYNVDLPLAGVAHSGRHVTGSAGFNSRYKNFLDISEICFILAFHFVICTEFQFASLEYLRPSCRSDSR